jgi:hypothetical protein
MPKLVTKITAEILPFYNGSVTIADSVTGELKMGTYISLDRFKAFLQDYSKAEEVNKITKPDLFGLKNQYNIPIVTLNISY